MTVKRFGVLLLCLLAMLALSACTKPIGNTPFESTVSGESSDGENSSIDNPVQLPGSTDSGDSSVPSGTNSNENTSDGDVTGELNEIEIDWEDIGGDSTTTTNKGTTTTSTTRPMEQEVVQGISLPADGYSPDGKIQIGTVKLDGDTVTMEIKNITNGYETNQDSYFEYICYDKSGAELCRDKLLFGRIHKQQSRTCEFTIPAGTAKVELGELKVEYWSDGFV